jgi:hypothetical protein
MTVPGPSLPRRLPWAGLCTLLCTLFMVLACAGGAEAPDDPPPEPPPAPDEAPPPPPPPPAEAPPAPGSAGPGAGMLGAADPAVIDAYLADCHHVFPSRIEFDVEGDAGNECLAREMNQMCAPDFGGCWGQSEGCKTTCGGTCSGCQDRCGSTCDDCKSRCGADEACRRGCAQARALCRGGCLSGLTRCQNVDCEAAYTRCEAEHAAKVKKECPDCEALSACLAQDGPQAAKMLCKAKFPKNSPACVEWCSPWG